MSEQKNPLLVNSEEAYQKVVEYLERLKALPKEERKRIEQKSRTMLIAELRALDRARARSWEQGAHRVIR